ncbi:MAG: hypothetical protein QM737_20910 [Ferruginibacter sp.]
MKQKIKLISYLAFCAIVIAVALHAKKDAANDYDRYGFYSQSKN